MRLFKAKRRYQTMLNEYSCMNEYSCCGQRSTLREAIVHIALAKVLVLHDGKPDKLDTI